MGTSPSQTSTVQGKTVSITVNGINTAGTAADLTIDGVSYNSQAASTYITTSSGVRVYVKSVSLYGTGGAGRVVFKVGADKIQIKNADYVRTGTNLDIVKGAWGIVTASGADTVSQFQVAIYAADSETNYIKVGSKFVDPVFKTIVFDYEGLSPSLTSTARDTVKVTYSGDNYVTADFTDYRGYSKSLTFASNYENSASQLYTKLRDTTPYDYEVAENVSVAKYNYTIVNQGGFSHILQVSDIDSTSTTKSATLRDIISSTDYKVTLSDLMVGTLVLDGKTYYVDASATNTSLKIFRGTATRTGSAALPIGLYAPLRLKNGEELVLAKPVSVANGTYYTVPGNNTVVGGEGLCTLQLVNTTTAYGCSNVGYTAVWTGTVGQFFPNGLNTTGNINSTGLVIIEEKDNANSRAAIYLPVSVETSGSTTKVNVDSANIATMMTGEPATVTSVDQGIIDTYVTKGVDYYGTLVTRSTDQQGTVTVAYPDEQVIALAFVGGTDMAVSLVGGTSGTCVSTTVNKVTTPVAKLDTEVTSTDKSTKNIISVGGPAVNSVTATLLGVPFPSFGAASTLPQNKGLIKLVDNAFGSGKTALVVAGWDVADTRRATSAVVAGTGLTGTSSEV